MAVVGRVSPYGGALVGGTSPIAFVDASSQASVNSNLVFEWDFDGDGDFDQAAENITHYVQSAQTMMGRDYPSSLTGRSGPGSMRLTLRNDDNRFSYFNKASPLNAAPFSLKTGRKIRVRSTDAITGAASISYVGIGAATSGNYASLVPSLPTGLQAGDLMIIVATVRALTAVPGQPLGWSKMVSGPNVAILAKFYELGDTAPTVTFTGGATGDTTTAQCMVFRGTARTLSKAFAASTAQLNGSAQNVAVPGLVAPSDAHAHVVVGWKQTTWTGAATLTGFTEEADVSSASGSTAAYDIQYRLGSTGTATFSATTMTITGGVAASSRAIVFALAPAPALADPKLLAYDNFERPASTNLGHDDLGNAWTVGANGGWGMRNGIAEVITGFGATYNAAVISTIDVGTPDHYVQASFPLRIQDGLVGVVAGFTDFANYVVAYYYSVDRVILVREVISGTATTLPTIFSAFPMEGWDNMTIGLRIANQEATVYVGGQELEMGRMFLHRPSLPGTKAGIYGTYQTHSDVSPRADNFRVYDKLHEPIDGRVWTGYVRSVKTSVKAGNLKLVEVEAVGPLAGAAGVEVAAPRIVRSAGEETRSSGNHSVPAGCIVGDIFSRAGLLEPPFPLEGDPTSRIGAVAMKDGKALELARAIEVTERGFIRETPEGAVVFEDRVWRNTVSSSAWFSDTAGVGQFFFEEIEPLDHEAQVINRAMAQVSPTCPTVVDVTNPGDDDPSLDVQILVPNVLPGDLVLVFVACSAQQDGQQWQEPLGWKLHRNVSDQLGIRVYSLIADGTESGTQVYFLKTSVQGTFLAHTYVIRDWYGTDDGIKLGRVSSGAIGGTNAYPITPGWNRAPALYILFQGAIGANTGILWDDLNQPPPVGYNYHSLNGLVFVTSPVAYETGVESVYKTDVTDTEDPGPWKNVFKDYLLLESVVVAIRGYNGPLGKPTNDHAQAVSKDGLVVSIDDEVSQQEHHFVRTNPTVPEFLYTKGDAEDWCQAVLTDYADDRPIITITFTASKNAGLRGQALRRRVSDRISVTANGNAGLGIQGDFFIENVHHAWSNGTKLWVTTWECSPVGSLRKS